MMIVDGQIHLWAKGTPSAHHRQLPYLVEQAIADMDAGGIDRALIHPVLWDPDSNELAIDAVRPLPGPLRDHGLVLSRRPARARDRRALEGAAGHARAALLHQRPPPAILVHRRHARLAVAGGRAGRGAGVARRGDVPADRRPDRRAPPRSEADRRPHGRAARQQGRGRLRFQPELLALAKCPNVAVKATGQAGYAEDDYPFRSLHPHLHRCFDAFGPERMFWGTDITRMHCTWRQCVTLFTEELPWLKGRDLELVMGEALCRWVGWPLPGKA